MLDFIIDFFMEVANFFTDLWINKIRAKKKKNNDKTSKDKEQK